MFVVQLSLSRFLRSEAHLGSLSLARIALALRSVRGPYAEPSGRGLVDPLTAYLSRRQSVGVQAWGLPQGHLVPEASRDASEDP